MVASFDARVGSRDVELASLLKDLVQCGMSPSQAADQAARELTVRDVRASLEASRMYLDANLPFAPTPAPSPSRRRRWVVLVTTALVAAAAVPASSVVRDPVTLVVVLVFGGAIAVLAALFVELLLRTDHREVDESLPPRADLLAEHVERLRDAERMLESCRPVLLAPLDRYLAEVRRELATREAQLIRAVQRS